MIQVSSCLYRGSRPKSLNDLKDLGITTIINLESGVQEVFHDDPYEFEKTEDYGMVKHNIKCSDFTPPSQAQVHQVMHLIDRGGVTYIHCLHGKDRTGFMCAVYKMRCGWSFRSAVSEMFSLGFHKWPYIWWVPFLAKYEVKK